MEYWENNNPDERIVAHIEYYTGELTIYEDTAFRVVEELVKKYNCNFCYEPNSPIWNEFYNLFKEEFIKDNPKMSNFFHMVSEESWKIIGINTFATKFLKTNRERRDWQYKIWGILKRPVDMLAIVIEEKFPQMIENLDENVSPYFIDYKNFKEAIEQEKSKNYQKIGEEVKNALINETGEKDSLFLKYADEYHSRVSEEYKKRFSEIEEESQQKVHNLYQGYLDKLVAWFRNFNICNKDGEPPKFIIEHFHKLIAESYFNRSFNAQTNIWGWCSKFGTHSITELLNKPKSKSGLWAWPMTHSVNFLFFKPTDFEFKFPAWLPHVPPHIPEKHYEAQLRKQFETQLGEYLSKVRGDLKTYELKTKSSPGTLEEHIEWLIHRVSFNAKYEYLRAEYNKSLSTIKEGIDNAASILNVQVPQSSNKKINN